MAPVAMDEPQEVNEYEYEYEYEYKDDGDEAPGPAAADVKLEYESDFSDNEGGTEMQVESTDVELTWQTHAMLMIMSDSEAFTLAELSQEQDMATNRDTTEAVLQVQEQTLNDTQNVQVKWHKRDESPEYGELPCNRGHCCNKRSDAEQQHPAAAAKPTKSMICRSNDPPPRSLESGYSVFNQSLTLHHRKASKSASRKRDHVPRSGMPSLEATPTQSLAQKTPKLKSIIRVPSKESLYSGLRNRPEKLINHIAGRLSHDWFKAEINTLRHFRDRAAYLAHQLMASVMHAEIATT